MDNTSRTTATIRTMVPFLSGDAASELLEGELVFDPTDPYAVTMHLDARSGSVVWTFARELLAEGVYEPVGDGDVTVWPCLSQTGDAVVIIELSSPDGTAMLQAPSRVVHGFVAASLTAVPAGHESARMDLDGLVSRLLAS